MNEQAHRYEDKLLELAYGELDASEARSIEAHVKGCTRCSTALQKIQGVRRQMSVLAPEPAPDAGLESLMAYAEQAARRAQAGPEPKKGIRRWAFALVGGASVAAVLIAVSVVSVNTLSRVPSVASIREEEAMQARPSAPTPAPPAGVAGSTVTASPPSPPPAPAADVAMAPREPPAPKAAPSVRRERERMVAGIADRDEDRADSVAALKRAPKMLKDSKYRESGADRFDKAQNFIPGRGTVPALPSSGERMKQKGGAAAEDEGDVIVAAPESKAPSKAAPSHDDEFDSLFSSRKGSAREPQAEAPGQQAASGAGYGEANKAGSVVVEGKADGLLDAKEAKKSMMKRVSESNEGGGAELAQKYAPKEESARGVTRMAPEPASAPPPAPAPRRAEQVPPPSAPSAAPSRGGGSSAKPSMARERESRSNGEQFLAMANRTRGSDDEIAYLERAVSLGLSGDSRLEALERLCKRLVGNAPRSVTYCTLWQRDARTTTAEKYAREARQRWSQESRPASTAQ